MNKKYTKLFYSLLLMLFATTTGLKAQTEYPISDYNGQILQVCDGIFTDHGGTTGGTVADTVAVTFDPNDITKRTQLDFTEFELGSGDTLYIYDGNNSNAELICKATSNESPGIIKASNANGSLTIEFKGKFIGTKPGWAATISCQTAPNNDVAIVDIITPNTGANLTANELVSVVIKNFGLNPQNNFNVAFSVEDANQVSNTIVETVAEATAIGSGESIVYSFSNKADLFVPQLYTIAAKTQLLNDNNSSNNSFVKEVENFGQVYLMGSADTIKACSGTFADDGGLLGNIYTELPSKVVIKSDDPSKRVKLNFESSEVGHDRVITIYDGIDANAPKLGEWGYAWLQGEITSTNKHGALYIELSEGYSKASGWRATISCYTPPVNDFAIQTIGFDLNPGYLDIPNIIHVQIQNTGSLAQSKTIKLALDGYVYAEKMSETIEGGNIDTVSFAWTPASFGDFSFSAFIVETDEDASNNFNSGTIKVYEKPALIESFEGDIFPPDNWIAGPSIIKSSPTFDDIPDGQFVASKISHEPYYDTLLSPKLNIKSGDKLTFSASMAGRDGGYLNFAYVGADSVFHDIKAEIQYSFNNFKEYTVDLSVAAGVNRIAFIMSGSEFHFDNIVGPELFAESDLELVDLIANRVAIKDDTAFFGAVIKNKSISTLSGTNYTLNLYKKGNPDFQLASIEGVDLNMFQTDTIEIPFVFEYISKNEIYVTIDFENDANQSNNTSQLKLVDVHEKGSEFILIGDGEEADRRIPMGMDATYTVTQVIYTKEQIAKVGDITAISYQKDFLESQVGVQTKIYIGETDATEMTTEWFNTSDFSLVFDNEIDYSMGTELVYLTLDKSYTYNGNKNIVLMVCKYAEDLYLDQTFIGTTTTKPMARKAISSSAIEIDNLPTGINNSYSPNTTFYVNSKIGTLSGKIVDNYGYAVENAKIQVIGIEEYSLITDNTGSFQFNNVILNNAYTIKITGDNYETTTFENVLLDSINYELGNLEINLIEIPFAVIAEQHEDEIFKISWKHESRATFEVPEIISDGSNINGYPSPVGIDAWAGNLIKVDKSGTLVGAYIWSVQEVGFIANYEVTVEVLDKTFKTVAVSNPFKLPDLEMIFVEMPYVSYNDDFYLMIHWENLDQNTNSLGIDPNSQNPVGLAGNHELGFFEAGGTFTLLPAMLNDYTSKQSKSFVGYDLYRGLQENMDSTQNWEKLNNIPIVPVDGKVTYYDYSWPPENDGAYMYAVSSIYDYNSSPFVYSNLVKYGLESNLTIDINVNGGSPYGVKVELVNTNNMAIYQYQVEVDSNGYGNLPVVEKGTYKVSVANPNFSSYFNESYVIENAFDTLRISLEETIRKPFGLKSKVNYENHSAIVSWNGYNDTTPIALDDGTYENGLGLKADANASIGNKFQTNIKGKIVSVDLFSLLGNDPQDLPLTVDIYDADQKHVATSNEFYFIVNEFATATFNEPVEFSGDFYAMVHWNSLPGNTYLLGLDLDGENTGQKLAYVHDSEQGFGSIGADIPEYDGVFAVRPAVIAESLADNAKSSSTIESNKFNNMLNILNVANVQGQSQIKGSNPKGFQSFNFYIDNMVVPFSENIRDLYIELSGLADGIHTIGISSVYGSGESDILKDTLLMAVGNKLNENQFLNVYPNPTNGLVNISNTENVEVEIYNVLGERMAIIPSLENNGTINMRNLENGTYIIKITGNNFSHISKIVLSK